VKNIYDDFDKYTEAIKSDYIKPSDIMKKITLPSYVYKYRRFDIKYMKDSLDGKMFFSMPADMNVNDSFDCRIEFDAEEVFKTMYPNAQNNILEEHPEFISMLEGYKKSLQSALRIGCFTTCDCSRIEMWDNKYFGDKHKGYCIKYKVEQEYFYPGTIVFLKVLYDNSGFDATDAMKNFVEWVKLQEGGMENSRCYQKRSAKMVCLGHNHTLFKPEEYKTEEEWRIIIPQNRFLEYFGANDLYIKDFSPLMQAIYLGSEFKNMDKSDEMYKYALDVCKRVHIPLYVMQRNGDKLEENIEYNPEEE
jgi:hypothetical protein